MGERLAGETGAMRPKSIASLTVLALALVFASACSSKPPSAPPLEAKGLLSFTTTGTAVIEGTSNGCGAQGTADGHMEITETELMRRARVDGIQARLYLPLSVDRTSRIFDASGTIVKSPQEWGDDGAQTWLATVGRSAKGRAHLVEMSADATPQQLPVVVMKHVLPFRDDGTAVVTGDTLGMTGQGTDDSPGSTTKISGVAFSGPAKIDGVEGRLEFDLEVNDQSRLLDASGRRLSPSAYAVYEDSYGGGWIATVRYGGKGRLLVVEMRADGKPPRRTSS